MRRLAITLPLFLATVVLPAKAEEIALKDGTKIVGHMRSISGDTIEVETAYGKIQLKRSDIVTIRFPENAPGATSDGSEATPSKTTVTKIDESLNGLQYVNRTGKFTLMLPPDWTIAADLRKSPDTLAALSSRDKMRYLIVVQEEYPGSLESYKELTLLNARRNLGSFEELSSSEATIDGKSALLVFYRGTLEKVSNLPVEFVSAIVQSGKSYTKISLWCVEPLFHDMQPAFEKVVNSYHSTSGQATASTSKP
jgi:hypothetical protein